MLNYAYIKRCSNNSTSKCIVCNAVKLTTMLTTIANKIINLLNNVSVTFAQVQYVTQVKTAAKHKHVNITKHTTANVQLFSNINSFTNVYANAVKKSANVNNFVTSSTYYTHLANCYSIVQHKVKQAMYLYCIYNNAQSVYYINNVQATKQQVAQYLTASAAKQLLNTSTATHNVTNNVTHNVVVRTIALQNIKSITANKQTITL